MTDRKPNSLLRQPGALRSQTSLEIQTRQAQRLVYGRRAEGGKPAIFGLLRFGTMLRPIWEGAATGDPWADWCLVQIERELLEAREALESLMNQVQRQLKSLPAMDVAVAQSVEPVRVDLAFSSPYAFMGAYLLADYDVLVRAVLTGRHIGLFDRDTAERTLREGGRIVRRAFNTAQGYKYLGVCREDLRQGTQNAERATDMLGALPQAVIEGTLRAAHAPDFRPVANTSSALLDRAVRVFDRWTGKAERAFKAKRQIEQEEQRRDEQRRSQPLEALRARYSGDSPDEQIGYACAMAKLEATPVTYQSPCATRWGGWTT